MSRNGLPINDQRVIATDDREYSLVLRTSCLVAQASNGLTINVCLHCSGDDTATTRRTVAHHNQHAHRQLPDTAHRTLPIRFFASARQNDHPAWIGWH
ncbi:hypothetical protein D3C71_1899900 [compost metagenome]